MAILDTGPGIVSPGPALTLETDSGGLSRQTKSPEHSMHPGLPDQSGSWSGNPKTCGYYCHNILRHLQQTCVRRTSCLQSLWLRGTPSWGKLLRRLFGYRFDAIYDAFRHPFPPSPVAPLVFPLAVTTLPKMSWLLYDPRKPSG